MAEIVSAFILPHDPMIAAAAGAAPEHKRAKIMSAFETVARRLAAKKVDTVITIGNDHYTNFGPGILPRCLIAVGDLDGPIEDWLGVPRTSIDTNTALAWHIAKSGFAAGIDWTVSKSLTLDHGAMVPIHYCVRPNSGMKTIPIYLATTADPVIFSKRAFEIGRSVGEAVRSWPGTERVAIFGTGGISHWPGGAKMGQVNETWDRRMLALAETGDVEGLMMLSDEEIMENGGNGSLEIKNWVCAMATQPGCRGELIAYEAVNEWICGCGFMELVGRKAA